MAKTLKEFLEERARADLRALQALQGASESFGDGARLAAEYVAHKDGLKPEINASHQAVNNAIQVAICGAGETAKKVERTRPDLKNAYPDYPWITLKRLRDTCSHPTRHYLNQEPLAPVQKHWKSLDDYYASTAPAQRFATDEPLLREIAGGWNVCVALRQLRDTFHQQATVNLTNNPKLDWIKKHQPRIAEMLPAIVAHYNQRHCLMGIGDAIDYTSVFFREAQNLPIDVKPILAVRNRAAHFADPPNHSRKPDDINIWDEMLQIEPAIKSLGMALTKVPRAKESEQCDSFSRQYASIYYDEIAAKIGHAPDKLTVLDRAVEFITKSPKNYREIRNAYVVATANLLEVASVEEVTSVMDYIESKSGDIREPEKMRAAISGVSSVTKTRLQQFLHEVATLSKGPGEIVGKAA